MGCSGTGVDGQAGDSIHRNIHLEDGMFWHLANIYELSELGNECPVWLSQCVCVCGGVEARGWHLVFSSVVSSLYILETRSVWTWNFPMQLDWLSRKSQGSCLCLPRTRIAGVCCSIWLLSGCQRQNSGPRVHATNTSTTELSPQPSELILLSICFLLI